MGRSLLETPKEKPRQTANLAGLCAFPPGVIRRKEQMQRPDYNAIGQVMELLKTSRKLRRLVWGCIAVAGSYVLLFGSAALLSAIRWW